MVTYFYFHFLDHVAIERLFYAKSYFFFCILTGSFFLFNGICSFLYFSWIFTSFRGSSPSCFFFDSFFGPSFAVDYQNNLFKNNKKL